MILPNPSISPLHSFASTPTVRRSPSFGETLGEVMRWVGGKPRPSFHTDRLREQRLVDEIAEQLDSPDTNPEGRVEPLGPALTPRAGG